jgi:hypothetical protein
MRRTEGAECAYAPHYEVTSGSTVPSPSTSTSKLGPDKSVYEAPLIPAPVLFPDISGPRGPPPQALKPALASIQDSCVYMGGISRAKFYSDILPQLQTVKLGRRHFVVVASMDRLIEANLRWRND